MATFRNALNTSTRGDYDGFSVADLYEDDIFAGYFNLNGNETVEKRGLDGTWVPVNRNYVVLSDDDIRFSYATGDKGSL